MRLDSRSGLAPGRDRRRGAGSSGALRGRALASMTGRGVSRGGHPGGFIGGAKLGLASGLPGLPGIARPSPATYSVVVLVLLLILTLAACDESGGGDDLTGPGDWITWQETVFGYGATEQQCYDNMNNGNHEGGRNWFLRRCEERSTVDWSWSLGDGGSSLGLVENCPTHARRSDGLCYYCTSSLLCRYR